MKTIKHLKTKWSILFFIFGSTLSSFAQIVVNESFENTCSNSSNAFYSLCIPNWISVSGTPDNLSNFSPVTPFQGSKYAHMYAKYDYGCYPAPSRTESIALNYNFQQGKTYKITYAVRGNNTSFSAYTVTSKWILTNGLVNKSGTAFSPNEATQPIPSGSQHLPGMNSNLNTWTVNQHTFTASSNFSQLWFYLNITSTTINGSHSIMMYLDDVVIEEICTPTPTITGSSSFCEGTPINLTGNSNCTITNNVWTVMESDQFGNPIAGANEWWSPWSTGSPGVFTIPTVTNGGPNLQCGKYYLVKLAVQTANFNWIETTKVIFIKCPPSFNFKGSTSSICSGQSANLIANLTSGGSSLNYSLTWTQTNPAGGVIFSGAMASVTVSPSVTTTYTATITDNTTGCSKSQTYTVIVNNSDPSFNLTVNTVNNDFFTLSALANNQTASSIPGFGYAWFVEELDINNNSIFTFSNPNCWWQSLSTPTVYNGIDCVNNSYSGSSTIANCSNPTVGKFLYGHKYRITRAVWSNSCPWDQVSITIIPVKTQNGVELIQDESTPDFSSVLTLENKTFDNSISIYPNPSEGMFTIDLSDFESAQIEIYTVFGQKVKTFTQKKATESFDLTGCSKGIYWVKITSNGLEKRCKIILE